MAITLTDRQRDCLLIVQSSIRETGRAPSYDELCIGLGITSKSTVMRLLRGLESRGYIRRVKGKHRAIELISGVPADLSPGADLPSALRVAAGRMTQMADRLERGA